MGARLCQRCRPRCAAQAPAGSLAAGSLLLAVGQSLDARVPHVLRVAEPATVVYVRQARQLAYEMSGAGLRALPPAPPIRSDLARVLGADVFLIFLESYGAVSWDRPEFVARLPRAARAWTPIFATPVAGSCLHAVESTTFGGESWLAHISLLSGTEVRDEDTNVRLMAQQRETLVTAFSRHGYRTVAVMPGLQHAWPEGAFYGFDDVYDMARLGYRGPPFGWWGITDQFAIARMDRLAIAPQRRRRCRVFSDDQHARAVYSDATVPAGLDAGPDSHALRSGGARSRLVAAADWLNLGPGYAQALDYAYASLGGYLRCAPIATS